MSCRQLTAELSRLLSSTPGKRLGVWLLVGASLPDDSLVLCWSLPDIGLRSQRIDSNSNVRRCTFRLHQQAVSIRTASQAGPGTRPFCYERPVMIGYSTDSIYANNRSTRSTFQARLELESSYSKRKAATNSWRRVDRSRSMATTTTDDWLVGKACDDALLLQGSALIEWSPWLGKRSHASVINHFVVDVEQLKSLLSTFSVWRDDDGVEGERFTSNTPLQYMYSTRRVKDTVPWDGYVRNYVFNCWEAWSEDKWTANLVRA